MVYLKLLNLLVDMFLINIHCSEGHLNQGIPLLIMNLDLNELDIN